MPANPVIQEQHAIIQRSFSIIQNYERAKAENEARFKREKEAIELSQRNNADEQIAAIHQSVQETQQAINNSRWRTQIMTGGAPSVPPISPSQTDFAQQMSQYCLTAELMSKKIRDFLEEEPRRADDRWFHKLVAGVVGLFAGMILILIMASIQLMNTFTVLVALVVPTLLPIIFLYRRDQQRNPIFQIRNDYATLQSIPPLAQSVRKKMD